MMLTQTSSLQSFISTLERQTIQNNKSDNLFLQGVIESFFDGILILTEQGKLIHANFLARQICEELTEGKSENNFLPKEIWRVCQALIESRSLYENQPVIIESEITTEQLSTLRIRTRWLQLSEYQQPCLLVILEDKHKSIQNLALSEVVKYGLTRRETEIWLLRRTNLPVKNIAAKLGISINTVKKHIKNIYAKRENFLYMEEWAN
jgi:DNA-binding CsgD family transcriptional regulator